MPRISIVTPTFNEVDNVGPLHDRIKAVMATLPKYEYDHIYIDNASTDGTPDALRKIAAEDPRVRVILNARNFGHIRSPYYGLLQSTGECTVILASDLQDPPELITQFLEKWEQGYKVVMGVKISSQETFAMWIVRKFYYEFISRIANTKLVKNATGFGLYDRKVLDILRKIDDPYPYFRGLVSEIGFEAATIAYQQPARKRGISSNNFYTLYDLAMLGITNHSRIPLRLATMLGFATSGLSLLVAMIYFVYKLLYWNSFDVGQAPVIIGVFFMASVQLFFIGIIGEYVGSIYTQVLKRPLVTERERINFPPPPET